MMRAQTLEIVRVYPDEDGETHFGTISAPWDNAADLDAAAWGSFALGAERPEFKDAPEGFSIGWHNSGYRMIVIQMTGTRETEVSDGEVRRFGPGSVIVFEDTTGKGHQTRSVGSERLSFVVMALPEEGLA